MAATVNQGAFDEIEANLTAFMGDLGETGLEYINAETPVDTGNLRRNNALQVDEAAGDVRWSNDTDYAPPVEFGHTTERGTHVPANPFMQRGVDRLARDVDALAERRFGTA